MTFKVVIPSAGVGSRIGPYTKFFNKALITVGDKPAICHVIDQFKKNIEIIILIGYKGEILEDVLKLIYDDRKLKFIKVDKFKGPGSGLGYSLNYAKKYLQTPFIFIANDTILPENSINYDPNEFGNWAGYYKVKKNINSNLYRTLEINRGIVTSINPKGTTNQNLYIGLCGILDYKNFWSVMTENLAIETGEAHALNKLTKIKAINFKNWFDIGNINSLISAQKYFKNKNHHILEKENEAIWFTNNTVVKFNINPNFIKDRVYRTKYLPKLMIPKILSFSKYAYKYKRIKGQVMSNNTSVEHFQNLIKAFDKSLWKNKKHPSSNDVKNNLKFYRDKTYLRLQQYLQRFEKTDKQIKINDKVCLAIIDQLNLIDWKSLSKNSVISRFHGDLHTENILFNKKKFYLLDWRQEFGGSYEFGDLYYDFAKLNHGFLVNHKSVVDNKYQVKEISENNIELYIYQYPNLIKCKNQLKNWQERNNYDHKKTDILTALIYINISSLHDYPYSKFLFYFGQYLLQKYIDNKYYIKS